MLCILDFQGIIAKGVETYFEFRLSKKQKQYLGHRPLMTMKQPASRFITPYRTIYSYRKVFLALSLFVCLVSGLAIQNEISIDEALLLKFFFH
jgi:hypothetical protein